MNFKTLLVVISMLYFIGASNALMCYNCTDFSLGCGETLSDPSTIPLVTCSGLCTVAKSTMSLGEQTLSFFSRTCELGCVAGCFNFEGISVCSNCCNADLCNNAFTDPSTGGNEENPLLSVGDADSSQGSGGGDSNALMCYDCTDITNLGCGETLSNPSTTPQVACSGTCMVTKTSVTFGENDSVTLFTRTCEMLCIPGCHDGGDGIIECSNCCNTDRCNGVFRDPSPGSDGGISNPPVCYICQQGSDQGCGETLIDPSIIPQTVCNKGGQCMVAKSTITVSGYQYTLFARGCLTTCIPGCIDNGDGTSECYKCCNTNLCNSAFTDAGDDAENIPDEDGFALTEGTRVDSDTVTPQYGDGDSLPTNYTWPLGGDWSSPIGDEISKDNLVDSPVDNNAPAFGNKGNSVAGDRMKYTTPTPSSAINLVVNFATILFTYLLTTTIIFF